MLTPSVSESKMNSWRLSSHIWPARVRKSIAANHSASVGSTSRMNACRCVTRLVMSRCKRGLGVPAKLLSTVSVMRSSLLSLIVQLQRHYSFRLQQHGTFLLLPVVFSPYRAKKRPARNENPWHVYVLYHT